ncbi:MAG TPA: porin family protein [Gammaproteobacteria bacterium]|nr:porin family protein [Gammaproteobacteria bacterium]
MRQLLILCLAMAFAAHAQAQRAGDRARSWEAGFHVVDMSSVLVADSAGSSIDVDNAVGYGFTGAYNVTNNFAVVLDYNWATPDYVARFVPDGPGPVRTISTELDITTIHVKAAYYFLNGSVTPFVELGLGWTNVDSNVLTGPPTTGCWWDPFWGYICESFYDTYSETDTSYSYGFGVRWDIAPEFMMRGSIGTLEVDIDSEGGDPSIDTVQFDFAWRF